MLNHLRVEQVLGRTQDRLAWAAWLAGSGKFVFMPISTEQGIVIMFQFIAREQRDVTIRTALNACD